jgi:hypothetical protein
MHVLIGLAAATLLAIGWFKGNVFVAAFLTLGQVTFLFLAFLFPVCLLTLPITWAPYFIRKHYLVRHQPIPQGGGIRVQYLHPTGRLLP